MYIINLNGKNSQLNLPSTRYEWQAIVRDMLIMTYSNIGDGSDSRNGSYYYHGSMLTIADEYKYLTELNDASKMPSEAYRFNPQGTSPFVSFAIENDRMFICDKHIQRLIFYGG